MKAFFSKYSFLIIWIVALAVIGMGFVLVVQPSLHFGSSDLLGGSSAVSSASPSSAPAPATPSVNLTIVKTKAGNSLYVQWNNLPSDTTALNIFRGSRNSTSGWSLWKTLALDKSALAHGNASIDIGRATLAGYSFYVEAVSGNNNGTGAGAGSNPTVLWTSSVTDPAVATSTPQSTPTNTASATGTQTSTSTASSTSPASAPTSTAATSTSPTAATTPSAPSGTPYYSPQVQIEGYAPAQTNNFWVQHVDQKIQIGWQNLPPTTTSIVILRSQNQGGPWAVVLTQQNPGVNGAYSIQVVDNTLGVPYYYEMNAISGGTTIAAYGPVYLPAQ